MGENIISWNFANWVTVVLMALIGYSIIVLISKFFKKHEELQNA